MVRTPLCEKHSIRHHWLKNSQREIWAQKEGGENPEPVPMEE